MKSSGQQNVGSVPWLIGYAQQSVPLSGAPAGGDKTKWKETNIGSHVSIGSNATILPVNITNNVVIGAGSVVTKDILAAGIYAGNPARKIR